MTSHVADALVGQLIDGRYRIIEHLADGGMASVYVALDSRLDREVALKLMRPGLAADPSFVDRFRAEAKASARLTHPNVVAVYDQGTDGENVFLAMELVRGKTLREVIHDEAPFTAREALAILDPILEALRAAHTAGLIHRDVKPENVIVRTDGEVKVADFGLARATNTATANQTGMLLGTVSYLSPEQVEFGTADTRSDVYAAGLLLYEMLTGRKAVAGDTTMQIAYAHVHGRIPAPSTVAIGVPTALDKVVATATTRDPDNRYSSAAQFLAALRGARRLLTPAQLDRRPSVRPPTAGPGSAASTTALPTSGTDAAHPTSRSNPGLRLVPSSANPTMERTRALPQTPPTYPSTRSEGEARRFRVASGPALEHTRSLEATTAVATEPAAPKARTARWFAVWLPILLALVVVAGSGWWFTQGPGSMTHVPHTLNLPVAQAESVLATAGLDRVETSEAFSETVAVGQVIDMEPVEGTEVRKRDTVQLVISKGLERYAVPNLINTRGVDAKTTVEEQPLKLVVAPEEFSETVAPGTIIRQDPKPHEKVKRDARVTIVVSKGRMPITVPTVVAKTETEAEAILVKAGLRMSRSGEANHDTIAKGSVISQTPDKGTLFRDGVVAVVISKGPVMVTVPNVVGKSQADAESLIKGAGLVPKAEFPLGTSLFGVNEQATAPGTLVRKGSTVVFTVV